MIEVQCRLEECSVLMSAIGDMFTWADVFELTSTDDAHAFAKTVNARHEHLSHFQKCDAEQVWCR